MSGDYTIEGSLQRIIELLEEILDRLPPKETKLPTVSATTGEVCWCCGKPPVVGVCQRLENWDGEVVPMCSMCVKIWTAVGI